MKQQTAVEWLFLMLNNPNRDQEFAKKLLNKALEIEKEQIIIAYQSDRFPCSDADAEDYYNTTFKKD